MRWLVERTTPQGRSGSHLEDVGAQHLSISDGCLIFKDDLSQRATYIVAAGYWITVVPDSEDEQ